MIKPQKLIAPCVINGEASPVLMARARSNARPLWAQARGSNAQNFGTAKDGYVAFDLSGSAAQKRLAHDSQRTGLAANNKVPAITVLNGQGQRGVDDPETFMQLVRPFGIVDVGNFQTGSTGFNILTGGVRTVTNNGNQVINNGDWVQVAAPNPEVLKHTGDPSNVNGGEVRLQFRAFDPCIHSLTHTPVYKCLEAIDEKKASQYLPAYRKACKTVESTARHHTVLSIGALGQDRLQAILDAGANDADGVKPGAFLERLNSALKANKRVARGLLFHHAAGGEKIKGGDGPKGVNKLLKKDKCIGKWFQATAILHNHVHKNIIGRAWSTAQSGKDFSLQITSYTYK